MTLNKKLSKSLGVFDLETTGANTSTAEIVQFAGIRIEPNGGMKTLKFLCKPSVPIEKGAEEVHGISNEMVKKELPFSSKIPEVTKFFEGSDVGGYNIANFDLVILDRQLQECGVKDLFEKAEIFDAFPLFKVHNSRTLSDAYKFYTKKEMKNAHDAMADVLATVEILRNQVDIEDKEPREIFAEFFNPSDSRVDFAGKITKRDDKYYLNFGKYSGKSLDQVDQGFLKWMMKQDFDAKIKSVVSKFIS